MNLPACLALGLMMLAPPLMAAPGADVLSRPALQSPQALHAVLQAITRSGERLVAVGERGTVLLSDDNGAHWRQVAVPVLGREAKKRISYDVEEELHVMRGN